MSLDLDFDIPISRVIILIIILVLSWFFYQSYKTSNEPIADLSEVISFPISNPTQFIPEVITAKDKSTFKRLDDKEQAVTSVFDHRSAAYNDLNVFRYDALYEDGQKTEVLLNPEFKDTETAGKLAKKYAGILGQLPLGLRKEIYQVIIHPGNTALAGWDHKIHIYFKAADQLEASNILEELLLQKAVHAAFGISHQKAPEWNASQRADNRFLSMFAKKHPDAEDLPEAFLFYLAARYRTERIEPVLKDSILATIPNRIKFFDNMNIDMAPIN